MTVIFGWILFCIATGMFATYRRNRSPIGWFFIALICSPLIAFVFLIILPVGVSRPVPLQEFQGRRAVAYDDSFGGSEWFIVLGIVAAIVCVAIAMSIH